jgi:hypothetical protein
MYGCKFVGGPRDGLVEGFVGLGGPPGPGHELMLLIEEDRPLVSYASYFWSSQPADEGLARYVYRCMFVYGVGMADSS